MRAKGTSGWFRASGPTKSYFDPAPLSFVTTATAVESVINSDQLPARKRQQVLGQLDGRFRNGSPSLRLRTLHISR
jgi:hypothetical protein